MTDLKQPDEAIIKGEVMKRSPSEGWIFILLSGPGTANTLRLDEQPSPKDFLHFHRQEDPDADAIIYSLMGRDDKRKEAYYLKGSWGYAKPTGGPVIEA